MKPVSKTPLPQIQLSLEAKALIIVSEEIHRMEVMEDNPMIDDLLGKVLTKIRHRSEAPRKNNRFTFSMSEGCALAWLISNNHCAHPLGEVHLNELLNEIHKQIRS